MDTLLRQLLLAIGNYQTERDSTKKIYWLTYMQEIVTRMLESSSEEITTNDGV